jgi:hypothetical protein
MGEQLDGQRLRTSTFSTTEFSQVTDPEPFDVDPQEAPTEKGQPEPEKADLRRAIASFSHRSFHGFGLSFPRKVIGVGAAEMERGEMLAAVAEPKIRQPWSGKANLAMTFD